MIKEGLFVSPQKLWIAADAGTEIGLGHVMRCRSVARILSKRGWSITWFCAPDLMDTFRELALPGDVKAIDSRWQREGVPWQSLVKINRPDFILLDSYHLSTSVLSHLRSNKFCVGAFDDGVLSGPLPIDLLVNYSPFASSDSYGHRGVRLTLAGLKFAPLDEVFCQNSEYQQQNPRGNRLFVSFGGGDAKGLTLHFLKLLEEDSDLRQIPTDLVTGAAYADPEKVAGKVHALQADVRHFHNCRDMAQLMSHSRMAVSAAGSTVYELAVMGVPACLAVVADNQLATANWIQAREAGIMIDCRERIPSTDLRLGILNLWNDDFRLRQMRGELPSLCDGLGAVRIADAIEASVLEVAT